MSELLVNFKVSLRGEGDEPEEQQGPFFHRWLPDGEKDAITLDTSDKGIHLRVWFERCGYTVMNMVEYDDVRREVDPAIMRNQARLDGGPLVGQIKLDLKPEELTKLTGSEIGDDIRIRLAQKLIDHIQPATGRLVDIVRTTYGQYWLPEFRPWDSRQQGLGFYCRHVLHLYWSFDSGSTWSEFVPDQPTVRVHFPREPDYSQYITESDWRGVAKLAALPGKEPLAAMLISQSRNYLHSGDLRHAVIEGVSALDVAVNGFMREKLKGSGQLQKVAQSFFQLGLAAQAIIVMSSLGDISAEEMEIVARLVDVRNNVVHKGLTPSEDDANQLEALLKTTSKLIPGPVFKFPTLYYGNRVMSSDEWQRAYEGKPDPF